ncbi:MAG: YaaR family protein [Candidatus Sericytochromatia bacterium]
MQVENDPTRKRRPSTEKVQSGRLSSQASEKAGGFQQVFSAGAAQIKESLDSLMTQVDSLGTELLENPSERSLVQYTQAVRNFIRKAQGQSFTVERNFDRHNRLYTLVREVDENLAQLTDQVLNNQWKALEMAARLQEIRGILLDMFI